MATYSEDIIYGINVALNEATLLGVEFQRDNEVIAVSFAPVAIDVNGQVPTDNRVQFVFRPIGRFIASYRLGHWDDKKAKTIRFEPEQILQKVEEFGHCSIYGWEFINCKKDSNYDWRDKLSFDYNSHTDGGRQNSIDLFQEGLDKHIDIKIWFDEFEIFSAKYDKIDIQTFIDNGKRAWDGIYNGDTSETFGIYPSNDETHVLRQVENTFDNSGIRSKEHLIENGLMRLWKRLWDSISKLRRSIDSDG